MRLRGGVVAVVAFLLFQPCLARAQSEAGGASVAGVVHDTSGAVITHARVSVTREDAGWSRDSTTTRAGLYAFLRLPPGTYTITVTSEGFETFRQTGLELAVGARGTVDVVLVPVGVTESVNVSVPKQLVDTARTSAGSTVKERAVRNLPINGRNFLDFTLLTPGVTRDPRQGDLSIAGQRGPANSVLVDGSDANSAFWGQSVGRAGFRNPYSFSMDAVQEFQVNTSSYAPELGRATGGVINVITKSGSNDLAGTGFWFFRDRSMNANTFFRNKAGQPKPPYRFNQFGGNLGGPILRDRLFFFYNYDGQRNTAPNSVFFPVAPPTDALSQAVVRELTPLMEPYQTGLHNDIHTIKVDWMGNPRHTVSGRYNRHRFLGENWESPGSQSASSHTGDTVLNTDSASLAHTWIFPRVLLDQRFTYVDENNPSIVSADGPEVVVRQAGVTMLSFGRLNVLPRYTRQHKTGFTQTLAWNAGRHTVKVGHDLKFERAENLAPTLFYGSYTFNSLADFANRTPVSYAQAFQAADTKGPVTFPDSNAIAVFAQDSWRATDRLTLDYGLRYDYFSYAGNSVRNPDPGLAALGYTTGVMPRDPNDIAARLGFVFRPLASKEMVVRGGFGTFYGMIPGLVPTIQAQNGIQLKTLTLTGNAMPAYPAVLTQPPTSGGAAPDIYVMDPDFRSPRTHQWSTSVDTAIGHAIALSIGYVGSHGTDLPRVRDVNLGPNDIIAAQFSDGTPVTFTRHPGAASPLRPNLAFGRISVVESSAISTYHAAVLQATIKSGFGLTLDTSYTLASAIDTAPEATMFVVNSAVSDVTYVQDPQNPDLDRGYSDAHARHRFVLSGVWDVRGGWQFSAITSAQSGRWFSARTNVDLNNDGNRFSDRAPGFGRNTIEGPIYASVDLRIAKTIPLGGRRQIRLIAEGFNMLNRANVSAIQQVAYTYDAATRVFTPSPTFRTPTDTSDPRILQIAARVTF